MKKLPSSRVSPIQEKVERFYSPKQAAELLDVKLPTLRRWCSLRKLEFVRVGNRLVRIPEHEIVRLTSNVVSVRPSEMP